MDWQRLSFDDVEHLDRSRVYSGFWQEGIGLVRLRAPTLRRWPSACLVWRKGQVSKIGVEEELKNAMAASRDRAGLGPTSVPLNSNHRSPSRAGTEDRSRKRSSYGRTSVIKFRRPAGRSEGFLRGNEWIPTKYLTHPRVTACPRTTTNWGDVADHIGAGCPGGCSRGGNG
jgi:hypothetical protein